MGTNPPGKNVCLRAVEGPISMTGLKARSRRSALTAVWHWHYAGRAS
uniref:Uncharacterized protein n=1 Tax=Rhizobium leguminosarum bv. viciae TaxID=387 RepID=A0A0U2YV65_RHILV|nr:hypothetical protein [Rhizobium leguminosarum bv. viciae]